MPSGTSLCVKATPIDRSPIAFLTLRSGSNVTRPASGLAAEHLVRVVRARVLAVVLEDAGLVADQLLPRRDR